MAVHAVRQETLDTAYALHPGRFPNGPPQAAMPPAQVHINPLESLVVSIDQSALAEAKPPAGKPLILPHARANPPRRDALVAAAATIPS
jgi:hypothetical protein